MTDQLLAQVKGQIKDLSTRIEYFNRQKEIDIENKHEHLVAGRKLRSQRKPWLALLAILEIPKEDVPPEVEGQGRWDWLHGDGYNLALLNVREVAEEALK